MKLKKWMQVALVGVSIIALSACSSKHKSQDQSEINDANDAYNGAQSSGLGDQSNFGDEQSPHAGNLIAKRVYYFDFDSDVVHADNKPAIAANAEKLVRLHGKAMLEGHTDPRGSREYNIGLGERRAKAVAAILRAKGVNPAQIRIVSYGAEKLAAPGHSEADYQKDRRVVLVYLK